MLLVQPISDDGLAYYFDAGLDARIAADYGGRRGHFGGEIARDLGLERVEVDQAAFEMLLRGVEPSSGRVLDPSHHRVRHAFFDVVFTAPKSVSLLFALSEPTVREAVLSAHERARDATLGYLGREAAWVKEPSGARRSERAGGFCWVPFVHRMSRSGDPHLHSHVLVANLSSSSSRGWSPIDSGPIYGELRPASALYGAALRYELRVALGVEFRSRTAPASDVAGFSDRVIDTFSARSLAIREANTPRGPRWSPEGRRSLSALRPSKTVEPPMAELVGVWRDRAERVGVVADHGVLSRGLQAGANAPREDREGDELDRVIHGEVVRFTSAFFRRDLIVATGKALTGGAPIPLFEARIHEALSTLGSAAGSRSGDSSIRRRRFDRRDEAQYLSPPVESALRAEAHYRASALLLEGFSEPDRVRDLLESGPAVLLAGTEHAPALIAASIRRLREAVEDCRPGERLLAPSARAGARFESVTGAMRADGALDRAFGPVPELTLLVDASRFDVSERARLVTESLAKGDLVVICDLDRPSRGPALPQPLLEDDASRGLPTRWYHLGERSIGFAPTLARAIIEVRAMSEELGPDAVVIADDRHAGMLGVEVITTSGLARAEVRSGSQAVILGSGETVQPPPGVARCTYVVPAPVGISRVDEEAMAFALMRPPSRAVPGSSLSRSPSARLAWGWRLVVERDRAARAEERARSQGQERSPQRGTEGRGEHDGADPRAEEQDRSSIARGRDGARLESALPTRGDARSPS